MLQIPNGRQRKTTVDFFYSVPPGTESERVLGVPHYSWRVACERFLSMFEIAGLSGQIVTNPHIYSHSISRQRLSPHLEKPPHLIFRPFDQIRPLKIGYNIGCVVWEFDRLTSEREGQHPFSNQVRMLSCLDEIWTASTFAQAVYADAGFGNVHLIPAPIASRRLNERKPGLEMLSFIPSVPLDVSNYRKHDHNVGRSKSTIRPLCRQMATQEFWKKKIFISVLNPGDDRKNIEAMLTGFMMLHARDPNAILIIKCTVDNTNTTIENVQANTILSKVKNSVTLSSDGVIFITSYLSDDEMDEFYRIADFYLCTSRCEGQNLPLLEAMSYGVVPVSVDNTAMRDYINEENAFVIPSEPVPVLIQNATAQWQPDLTWYEATDQGVYRAVTKALQASTAEITRKRTATWKMVEAKYSIKAVFGRVSARLEEFRRATQVKDVRKHANV